MLKIELLTLLLLVSAGCYRPADTPILTNSTTPPTLSISEFRDHYVGSGCTYIADKIVMQGRVISSDRCENFYRTLLIDDGTAAVELLTGLYNTHADYPEGLRVALHVEGLAADYSRGVLQIGRKSPTYSPYPLDYLASSVAMDNVVERSLDIDPISPITSKISSLNSSMYGRLVRIDSLRLIDASSIDTLRGDDLRDARWYGYALFRDKQGDSIVVYTSDYATYADNSIPQGYVAIQGIVQASLASDHYAASLPQLKMRYAEDCSTY